MASKAPDPFRILAGIFALLLIVLGVAALNGCTATQETQNSSYRAYIIAGEARVSAIRTLIALNEAG